MKKMNSLRGLTRAYAGLRGLTRAYAGLRGLTRAYALIAAMIFSITANGQGWYPSIQWEISTPSTYPEFDMDDNWIHSVIQASDGNFIGVGFSDHEGAGGSTTAERHEAIAKFSPTEGILWERITTFDEAIEIADTYAGGFADVFESTENGIR